MVYKRQQKELTLIFAAICFNYIVFPFSLNTVLSIFKDLGGYLIVAGVITGIGVLYLQINEFFEKHYKNFWLVKFLYISSNPNNATKIKEKEFSGYFAIYTILNILLAPAAILIKWLSVEASKLYKEYGRSN